MSVICFSFYPRILLLYSSRRGALCGSLRSAAVLTRNKLLPEILRLYNAGLTSAEYHNNQYSTAGIMGYLLYLFH